MGNSQSFEQLVGPLSKELSLPVSTQETHGTTVLCLRYNQGILTLADRRATMGHLVMYDQAKKIVALDDHTIIAISGSYARSMKVCRYLKHSLKYYRRTHLTEMSAEGKVHQVSRSVAENTAAAQNGAGIFIPLLANYNPQLDKFEIHFFDGAGAHFYHHGYACAGSGSERIRGIFEYLSRAKKPFEQRTLLNVLVDGLLTLDIAADLDSATGGFNKILPAVRVLNREGTHDIQPELLEKAAATVLKG